MQTSLDLCPKPWKASMADLAVPQYRWIDGDFGLCLMQIMGRLTVNRCFEFHFISEPQTLAGTDSHVFALRSCPYVKEMDGVVDEIIFLL